MGSPTPGWGEAGIRIIWTPPPHRIGQTWSVSNALCCLIFALGQLHPFGHIIAPNLHAFQIGIQCAPPPPGVWLLAGEGVLMCCQRPAMPALCRGSDCRAAEGVPVQPNLCATPAYAWLTVTSNPPQHFPTECFPNVSKCSKYSMFLRLFVGVNNAPHPMQICLCVSCLVFPNTIEFPKMLFHRIK